MLTDAKGTKYINVKMIFRQIGGYVFSFMIALFIFTYVSITTIRYEIDDIKTKNSFIQKQYDNMIEQSQNLNDELAQKKEEMTLIGDRVEDLEDEVGVQKDSKSSEGYNLVSRMDMANVTGMKKAFVMKFIPNGNPLQSYSRVSAPFGKRKHPILHVWHMHTGIDFAAHLGTKVYASADGVVDWANNGYNGGYGKLVKISHSFGFRTYYAHLSKIAVYKGEFVKKGQLIAYVGSTGSSTGPHLHYEIRFLGKPINPKSFINWDMANFNGIFTQERNIAWQSLLATINSLMGEKEQQRSLP